MAPRSRPAPIASSPTLIPLSGPGMIGMAIKLDLTPLARALGDVKIFEHDQAIYRGINRGLERYQTRIKRDLQKWTGIKVQKRITEGMRISKARPGKLYGEHITKDRWLPIDTPLFGAAWRGRSSPGGTHSAWGRGQTARHSFMVPRWGTRLFTRKGASRFPVKKLWGPNMARELERHQAHVGVLLTEVTAQFVMPEILRQIHLEFGRVKGKYGL